MGSTITTYPSIVIINPQVPNSVGVKLLVRIIVNNIPVNIPIIPKAKVNNPEYVILIPDKLMIIKLKTILYTRFYCRKLFNRHKIQFIVELFWLKF